MCQRTVLAPKVDDCSKSGVCVADERYENIWLALYHPESRRGEHLLSCDFKIEENPPGDMRSSVLLSFVFISENIYLACYIVWDEP